MKTDENHAIEPIEKNTQRVNRRKLVLFIGFSFVLVLVFSITPTVNYLRSRGVLRDDSVQKEMLSLDTIRKLKENLEQGKAGEVILVDQPLKFLVPEHLTAVNISINRFGVLVSDENPVKADYILSRPTLCVRSLIFAEPSQWQLTNRVRMEDEPDICLLKRKQPINEQLEPIDKSPKKKIRFDRMIRVPGNETQKSLMAGRYEITHGRYAKFLNDANIPPDKVSTLYHLNAVASRIVYYESAYRVIQGAAAWPVFNVSLYGAQAFCKHYGQRIPTQSQWLFAAGANDGRHYPWGDQNDFEKRANFFGGQDGYEFWSPVGVFPDGTNPHGMFDVAGNIYEWTTEGFLMGGSWVHGPPAARLTSEDNNVPGAQNLHDGFRCIADVK